MKHFSPAGGWPSSSEIMRAISSFSARQKIIFLLLVGACLGSFIGLAWGVNQLLVVEVAVLGGALHEGIIGAPSHINPLLALSDADRDVTTLVYAGLLRADPTGGLAPDLAERYEISPDGLTYTFYLRPDLHWQDGAVLSAADIAFTIARAQDPAVKSPKRGSWGGVTVEELDEQTIRFTLKKPYAQFLENTTIGILPKHLWQNVPLDGFALSQYNLRAIGAGPYQIATIETGTDGLPDLIRLTPFRDYAGGPAKLKEVNLHFYPNERETRQAFTAGTLNSLGGLSPALAEELRQEGLVIEEIPLPRIFAIFFNANHNLLFQRAEVRHALDLATDRQAIVADIFGGYAQAVRGPIPPGSFGYDGQAKIAPADQAQAEEILAKGGWKKGADGILVRTEKSKETKLTFTLATTNTPELKATAEAVAQAWRAIGVGVTVAVFDLADLDQNLIRPRKFDALLFGEIVGRDPDPYAFWHSSQRNYPGLNISQYTSSTVDEILEAVRQLSNPAERLKKYSAFQKEIAKDVPAVFLYSPAYLYVLPETIRGAVFPSLATPADRFSAINRWYENTEKVWSIFAPAEK